MGLHTKKQQCCMLNTEAAAKRTGEGSRQQPDIKEKPYSTSVWIQWRKHLYKHTLKIVKCPVELHMISNPWDVNPGIATLSQFRVEYIHNNTNYSTTETLEIWLHSTTGLEPLTWLQLQIISILSLCSFLLQFHSKKVAKVEKSAPIK